MNPKPAPRKERASFIQNRRGIRGRYDQGDGSNDHLIDTRPAFLSALS